MERRRIAAELRIIYSKRSEKSLTLPPPQEILQKKTKKENVQETKTQFKKSWVGSLIKSAWVVKHVEIVRAVVSGRVIVLKDRHKTAALMERRNVQPDQTCL